MPRRHKAYAWKKYDSNKQKKIPQHPLREDPFGYDDNYEVTKSERQRTF